jgi:sugar/nucleoside kinase (ribokinase family)
MTSPAEAEPSVFFIGEVSLDEYFTASRWPGIADKAYVKAGPRYVGGMIGNAACVYAGLGGRAEVVSLMPETPLSRDLCQALEARGVSTRHMLFDPGMAEPRNLIILVEGEHVVLTIDVGSQPMPLGAAAIAELMRPGWLYTTLVRARRLRAGPLAGVELFAELRRRGRRLVLDLDVEGFGPDDVELLRGAAAVIFNRIGFERSFGAAGPKAVPAWMVANEVRLLVRTLADEGAEIFDGTGILARPALHVPVVDVTGAGDSFGGALVFGLTHGFSLLATIELAIAAGSRAVTIEGPQGGVVSLAALRDFAAAHGRPLASLVPESRDR